MLTVEVYGKWRDPGVPKTPNKDVK